MNKPIPQQVKLYILLAIIIALSLFFLIAYSKSYVSYYIELYDYKNNLIQRLTSSDIKKPVLSKNDPYLGNPRSSIVIFEYGDFSCEACRAIQPTLEQIRSFYGNQNILLIWKDLPISIAPYTKEAHLAAHCANEQNAFFDYKEYLYNNQSQFSTELFKELAAELNLNKEQFNECLDSKKYDNVVTQNLHEGLQMGVDGTPTLFINNTEVVSGFNFENIRSIIEQTR